MAQDQDAAASDPLIRIHARQAGRARRWSTAARLALALALAAVFEVAWHPEHLFDAVAWTWWLESGVIARAQLRRERSARAELDALVRRNHTGADAETPPYGCCLLYTSPSPRDS